MPRTYIKKKEPPRYTLEDVRRAVDDVTNKKKTFRQASEDYGIPTAVIFHRIKGRKVSLDKMGGGVTKALPDRVEHHIVNCLKTRARMGHPCHKEELKLLVGEYVTKLKIKTPFKNNIPGDCWYQCFMKRHPSLSLKKPELLQKARTDARRPHVVYDFYDMLLKEVNDNNLTDKPRYIFNADESGFHSDPSKLRAIGEKGTALSRITGGSGRESTSVLACVAADGSFLPPCIVFKGAAVQARWVSDEAYPGTLYGASKNGWMEEPIFHNWLINGFIPYINNIRQMNNEPDHKVILIYDGHSSHISVRIVEDAIKANIILIKFPSHLTDRIQPLDKCVFGPVKTYWDKKLVEHGVKQMGKGSAHLSKDKFGELLGEVWGQAFTAKNIVSGFSTTGIFPVDATKFPKKLFKPNELKIYYNLVNAINESETSMDTYDNNMSTEESQNFPDIRSTDKRLIQKFIEQPSPVVILPHSSSSKKSTDIPEELNVEVIANSNCSGFEKPTENTVTREIIDECANPQCSNFEKSCPYFASKVTIEDCATPSCSGFKKTTDNAPARMVIDECATPNYSSFEEPADSILARENENDYGTLQCLSFQKPIIRASLDETINKSAFPQCDGFEIHTNNDSGLSKKASSSSEGSSTLLNKILKLITLDTEASDTVKEKIIKAISASDSIEDIAEDMMSPNKNTLDKLFKIQKNTPDKGKKIVIPRLKVVTYGEVLTSDAVKERLKKAEEEKNSKGSKKTIKVEKGLKNKGLGKRTKGTNLNKIHDKENNNNKKPRLEETYSESKDVTEKTNKGIDAQSISGSLQKRKKVNFNESDESEEEETKVSYAESDNSEYNVSCETAEEFDFLETSSATDSLIKGNFVLAKFKGGKRLTTIFRYLCMVDSIDEDDSSEILVTSLKSVDSSKQVFALNEKDMSSVPIGDIIGILPEPFISLKGERIFYKFPKPVDIYEKA